MAEMGERMRKIIQIMPDHQAKAHRAGWLAVCDDGSVWRYHQVIAPVAVEAMEQINGPRVMIDPPMVWVWDRAQEFDELRPKLAPTCGTEVVIDPELQEMRDRLVKHRYSTNGPDSTAKDIVIPRDIIIPRP
jgi:hypothetical protein